MPKKKLSDLITVYKNHIDKQEDPDAKHAIAVLTDKLLPLENEIVKESDGAITILPGGWVVVNGFTNLSLAIHVREIAKACELEKYFLKN